MLKKNEIIRLEISGMTNEGNGVGKHEGIAVFVPFTVIGVARHAKSEKRKNAE